MIWFFVARNMPKHDFSTSPTAILAAPRTFEVYFVVNLCLRSLGLGFGCWNLKPKALQKSWIFFILRCSPYKKYYGSWTYAEQRCFSTPACLCKKETWLAVHVTFKLGSPNKSGRELSGCLLLISCALFAFRLLGMRYQQKRMDWKTHRIWAEKVEFSRSFSSSFSLSSFSAFSSSLSSSS